MVGFLTNPQSTGQITVVDSDPLVKPKFTYNFYSDGGLSNPQSDISLIVAYFKIIKAAASSLGITVLYPPPGDFLSDAALANDAKTNLGFFALADHLVRTTPMGTSIANGTVDSKLNSLALKTYILAILVLYQKQLTAIPAYLPTT